MILVHAGNRTDAADRDAAPRFPESNVADVQHRLGRLLEALKPTCVVTAAAAGADLILMREARRRKIQVRVVLPLQEPEFIERSIMDRGAHWLEMYRSVRTEIDDEDVVVTDLSGDDDWYLTGNGLILDEAQALRPAELVVALAVRPPNGENPASATDDFAERAKDRGLALIGIDPSKKLDDLKRAFVIMPFGRKRDPRSKTWVEFDSIFNRLIVPSLENASLNWQRADMSFETGLIHDGMIDQIANADVVVADLTTDNPNVYYELGLRHVMAPRTTVLLARTGTSAPFDIRDIRQFPYTLADETMTYEEAFAAYEALQEVIAPTAVADAGDDSPVYRLFNVDPRPKVTRTGVSPQQLELRRLENVVGSAEQLGQIAPLDAAAEEITNANAPAVEVAVLRLRLGIAMRLSGHYQAAANLLDSLAFDAQHTASVLWHRETAMALRRVGEIEEDHDRDPDPWWTKATEHLSAALASSPNDSESLGIQGGLLKRQLNRAIRNGEHDRARVLAKQATASYERAIDDDPTNFYVLFNTAAMYRLRGHHFGGNKEDLARAQKLLPVALFHAERHAANDFWAAVTVADIALLQNLLDGDPALDQVEDLYIAAVAMNPRSDMLTAVLNQLEIYRRAGDPPVTIDRIEMVLRGS